MLGQSGNLSLNKAVIRGMSDEKSPQGTRGAYDSHLRSYMNYGEGSPLPGKANRKERQNLHSLSPDQNASIPRFRQ
jgi:hypothetical protein